jgi:hypothetical protein
LLLPSIPFLFYFLPLFFIIYCVTSGTTAKNFFLLHAGKYIWMHHELCGFAMSVVEREAPDVVLLAPAERQMFCFGR